MNYDNPYIYFVDIITHGGDTYSTPFATYLEAQVFLMLVPVMQRAGEWLDIHRAIIRKSGLSLN